MKRSPNDRLAEALAYLPRSQREVAQALGVTDKHLSSVKTGHASVTQRLAGALEREFGIRALWLLKEEGAMCDPDHPAWGAITTTPGPPAEAIPRVVFHCGACDGVLARGRTVCPHCGATVEWPEEPAPGETEAGAGREGGSAETTARQEGGRK